MPSLRLEKELSIDSDMISSEPEIELKQLDVQGIKYDFPSFYSSSSSSHASLFSDHTLNLGN